MDEVWDLAMRPEGPPIERPKVEHIKQMLELSETLMKYIVGRPWSLVAFDRRSLITSDDPVCLVRDPKDDDSRGVGFMTAWGITFPLTRKFGLLLGNVDPVIEAGVPVERVHEGGVDMRLAGTTQLEKFFNYQTVANSSEWLFHHPDDSKFIPEALPEPTPVTVEMDQIEFTGDPWFGQSNGQGSGHASSGAAES